MAHTPQGCSQNEKDAKIREDMREKPADQDKWAYEDDRSAPLIMAKCIHILHHETFEKLALLKRCISIPRDTDPPPPAPS